MNLFSRLASYSLNPQKLSLENFTTELIAHFFNSNAVFRRRIVPLLFSDQRMSRRFLSHSTFAGTQETLGAGCRVDLVLHAGDAVHLVEVKIAANETLSARWGQKWKPQVQRYLDLKKGNVTFLTSRHVPPPEVDEQGNRRFRLVRHAVFEELYRAVNNVSVDPLLREFVDFMKSKGLCEPEPFSNTEMIRARAAFDFMGKAEEILSEVRFKLERIFPRNLGTYAKLSRPTFKTWEGGGGEWQCYMKKKRGGVRWVGFSIEPNQGGLRFFLWVWGVHGTTIPRIRDSLGWDSYWDDRGALCDISLRGTDRDIRLMISHVAKQSRRLNRAIRRFT